MQRYQILHFHRQIVGCLLVVWLFLGNVALAEQLNVVSETNSSGEQALTYLQLAVKSEPLNASIVATFLNLLALSVIISLSAAVTSVLSNPINSFVDFACSRSLPRFTCCYRL